MAFSYCTQANVEAFTPTILKVEGLQPGTRYAINFKVTYLRVRFKIASTDVFNFLHSCSLGLDGR